MTTSTSLPPELLDALRGLVSRRPLLVALDFDGVLAPLVQRPGDARPLAGVRALLDDLTARDDVVLALVSGRARADLAAVSGIGGDGGRLLLVGSHGAEIDGTSPPGLDDAALQRLEQVRGRLHAIADRYPGAEVEDKPSAAVLHTRQVDRAAAEQATTEALQALQELPGVHVTRGKEVVEVAVTEASKGAAVQLLRETRGVAAVLYVGDDVTDETVFRRLGPGDLGVKVGEGETAATVRIDSPAAVRELLRALRDLLAN